MSFIIDIFLKLLANLLPWIFSGEEKHTVSSVAGLADLDRKNITGVGGLSARDLPSLCVFAIFITYLSGCAFGGSKVEDRTVFVEAGAVCRIATDKKIPVVAKDDAGKDIYEERNVGGMIVTPVSVYRELRENWVKTHPQTESVKVEEHK